MKNVSRLLFDYTLMAKLAYATNKTQFDISMMVHRNEINRIIDLPLEEK